MNNFIQAMAGAMSVLRPNLSPGDSLAIIGSTDVDMDFYTPWLSEPSAQFLNEGGSQTFGRP